MKMYIDVDGVLLGKDGDKIGPAFGAADFIRYAVDNYECYWLTTHCRGNIDTVLKYLRPYVDPSTHQLMKRIQPTNFDIFKTEALNPDEEFIWIEDQLLKTEMNWLEKNSKQSSWYQINTYKNFWSLQDLLNHLKNEDLPTDS